MATSKASSDALTKAKTFDIRETSHPGSSNAVDGGKMTQVPRYLAGVTYGTHKTPIENFVNGVIRASVNWSADQSSFVANWVINGRLGKTKPPSGQDLVMLLADDVFNDLTTPEGVQISGWAVIDAIILDRLIGKIGRVTNKKISWSKNVKDSMIQDALDVIRTHGFGATAPLQQPAGGNDAINSAASNPAISSKAIGNNVVPSEAVTSKHAANKATVSNSATGESNPSNPFTSHVFGKKDEIKNAAATPAPEAIDTHQGGGAGDADDVSSDFILSPSYRMRGTSRDDGGISRLSPLDSNFGKPTQEEEEFQQSLLTKSVNPSTQSYIPRWVREMQKAADKQDEIPAKAEAVAVKTSGPASTLYASRLKTPLPKTQPAGYQRPAKDMTAGGGEQLGETAAGQQVPGMWENSESPKFTVGGPQPVDANPGQSSNAAPKKTAAPQDSMLPATTNQVQQNNTRLILVRKPSRNPGQLASSNRQSRIPKLSPRATRTQQVLRPESPTPINMLDPSTQMQMGVKPSQPAMKSSSNGGRIAQPPPEPRRLSMYDVEEFLVPDMSWIVAAEVSEMTDEELVEHFRALQDFYAELSVLLKRAERAFLV